MRNRIKVEALLLFLTLLIQAELAYPVPQNSVEQHKAVHPAVYVVEGLGGAVGTVLVQNLCGLCGLGLSVLFPWLREHEEEFILPFWYTTLATGAPIGVACTGRILHQKGSLKGALVGSAIGASTVLLGYLEEGAIYGSYQFGYFTAIIGAVIGYNYRTLIGHTLSARKAGSIKHNIQFSIAPTLCLRTIKGENQRTFTELSLNLISVRF